MQKVVFSILGAILVSVSANINFELDEEFSEVPLPDGSWKLMSRQEIMNEIPSQTDRFYSTTMVRYILHTRTYPEGVEIYESDEEGLMKAGFDASNPVRFTIHGWNGGPYSAVNAVKEYLLAGDFNHIVVDWTDGAITPNYIRARNVVPAVARDVGRMASFLVHMGSNWSKIYTIGHSLGGHMAALIGQYLEEGYIEACIVLDPARPLFSEDDIDERASPDDCKYVQVVHTNGGNLGFRNPIGDSDFYPNGGIKQSECSIDPLGVCSHLRAPALFAESLISRIPFEAWQCKGSVYGVTKKDCDYSGSTGVMLGDPINTNARGIYYLETAKRSEFALRLN